MDNLPEDLFLYTLAGLDRKSLIVAKQVSRRWRDTVCGNQLYKMREKMETARAPFIMVLDQVTEDPDPPIAERVNSDLPAVRMSFYDITSDRWRELPTRRTSHGVHLGRRSAFSCVSLGGRVYLLGGRCWQFDENLNSYIWKASAEVFVYTPLQNSWQRVASMGHARAGFACAVIAGKIYVAGGVCRTLDEPDEPCEDSNHQTTQGASRDDCVKKDLDDKSRSSSLQCFPEELASQDWDEECSEEREKAVDAKPASPKENPRQYDSFSYRFGRGLPSKPEIQPPPVLKELQSDDNHFPRALTSAEVYNPSSNAWSPIQDLPGNIFFPDEVSCQGQAVGADFIVLGRGFAGLDSTGGYLDERGSVFAYNTVLEKWRVAGPGPHGAFCRGFGTAVLESKLVKFAGLSMLRPSWSLMGQLMLSRNPPVSHFSLDYFMEAEGTDQLNQKGGGAVVQGRSLSEGDSGEAMGPSETASPSGCWETWSTLHAVPRVPKLCPACVTVQDRLYIMGSQERKMGTWEVFGMWRLPQPLWVFNRHGEGEWLQLARMPYSPVKPRAVTLSL